MPKLEAAIIDREKVPLAPEEKTQHRRNFLAVYDKLPLGERAFIEPMLDKVYGCISRGEIKAVIETISTYPAPTESLIAAREEALAAYSAEIRGK